MSEANEKNELSLWMSTYGLITAERILERYNIRLQHEELFAAMKNPKSFYFQILKIPLRNVFNGIILQQAYDYEIYAQKLFVDYLMSGESSKPEDSPGGFTREDIEKERKSLVSMSENFRECEIDHNKLIAESQKALIDKSLIWLNALSTSAAKISSLAINKKEDQIKQMINVLLVNPEITEETTINLKSAAWKPVEKIFGESLPTDLRQAFAVELGKLKEFNAEIENSLSDFAARTKGMELGLRNWRSDFHQIIIRVHELLKVLPEYHADLAQIQQNKESLYFDPEIGEG
ncbi:MAG: hypothetical protein H0T84_02645 [Tatlockia sp.]|nr:hypothetical protein [Tatlockia sp.]